MADTSETWGDDARWYPDIVAAGDARGAWRAEFDRQGATVEVGGPDGPGAHRYASAGDDGRCADLRLWRRQRRIRLVLSAGATLMLHGFAADVPATVGAARRWLGGARPGEVAAAWPFLGSVALAEARERRDAREAAWLSVYENHTDNPVYAPTWPFVALAYHEPRLRALRPVAQ
jgi:hypothetical protein